MYVYLYVCRGVARNSIESQNSLSWFFACWVPQLISRAHGPQTATISNRILYQVPELCTDRQHCADSADAFHRDGDWRNAVSAFRYVRDVGNASGPLMNQIVQPLFPVKTQVRPVLQCLPTAWQYIIHTPCAVCISSFQECKLSVLECRWRILTRTRIRHCWLEQKRYFCCLNIIHFSCYSIERCSL